MIADYAVTEIEFDARIAHLEAAIERGEDILSDAEELGREAAVQADQRRYILGDLACLVQKRYGQDMLGDFAKEINVSKKQLQEYRTTCAYWDKDARKQILSRFKTLSYSMLRLTAHCGLSPKDAVMFLQTVNDNNMSVEKARLALKEMKGETLPPQKLPDVHVCVTALDTLHGTMTVAFTGGLVPPVHTGQSYRMVLYVTEG